MDYAFIGDVHSDIRHLDLLLSKLPPRYKLVFLGDIFDYRKEDNKGDTQAVYDLLKQLGAPILNSNHQYKMMRWIEDNSTKVSTSMQRSITDLGLYDNKEKQLELYAFLKQCPLTLELSSNGVLYKLAHAYHPGTLRPKENSMQKGLCLYGPTYKINGSRLRLKWWESKEPRDFIRVAGHYNLVYVSEQSLILDSGCGTEGGYLTAYLTDTKELVTSCS